MALLTVSVEAASATGMPTARWRIATIAQNGRPIARIPTPIGRKRAMPTAIAQGIVSLIGLGEAFARQASGRGLVAGLGSRFAPAILG